MQARCVDCTWIEKYGMWIIVRTNGHMYGPFLKLNPSLLFLPREERQNVWGILYRTKSLALFIINLLKVYYFLLPPTNKCKQGQRNKKKNTKMLRFTPPFKFIKYEIVRTNLNADQIVYFSRRVQMLPICVLSSCFYF